MAYKQAFHANKAILDSFVCDYSAIVGSFVMVSFLRNITVNSNMVTNKLHLCLFARNVGSRWLVFWV